MTYILAKSEGRSDDWAALGRVEAIEAGKSPGIFWVKRQEGKKAGWVHLEDLLMRLVAWPSRGFETVPQIVLVMTYDLHPTNID
jgi:hypothetical protein